MNGDMSDGRAPEVVLARLRPHGRRLFWPSVVLIAACGAAAFVAGPTTPGWLVWTVLGSALAAVVLLTLVPVLLWMSTHYTITSRRIVIRRGFLVRVRQELLHSRGYDVTVRQNAWQRLWRSGTVEINTGLEHPVTLRDVPGAATVQEALHDLMDASLNPVAARRQQAQSAPPDETVRWGVR